MTLISSYFQRQLDGISGVINTDFAIRSLYCHKVDEHIVRGRDEVMEVPPFASRFSDSELGGHLLACADEDGTVKLLDTRKYGAQSVLKEWTAHFNAIFDLAWMEGFPKLVTASGDQSALLWDVETGNLLTELRGHTCSLKSVNFRKNDIFIIGTGARDGNIMVWDIRCNRRDGYYKPINVVHNAHTVKRTPQQIPKRSRRRNSSKVKLTDSQQSVTSVVFQDEHKLISAGAMDGSIKVWDLRKTYTTLQEDPCPYHVFPYPGNEPRKHGFSSLVLDSTQTRLFASCTNDRIYMYDCTVLKDSPLTSFTGHLNSTFYVKSALSPDDNYLLSGSSDNNAYIWNTKSPDSLPLVLKGHTKEVTCVDWCQMDNSKLVTCGDDNNIRIWRMNRNTTRDNIDIIGWCEDFPQKEKYNESNQESWCETPSNNSNIPKSSSPTNSTRSPLLRKPGTKMNFTLSSPSTLYVYPSTSSPCTTKLISKQQKMSSWLTPQKGKRSLLNNYEGQKKGTFQGSKKITITGKDKQITNKEKTSKKSVLSQVIGTKNKRALLFDETKENKGTQDNIKGKRNQEMFTDDKCNGIELQPAKKRQCITSLNESSSSKIDRLDMSEKVNIEFKSNDNSQLQEKCSNGKKTGINWFTNWRLYINQNKMTNSNLGTITEEIDGEDDKTSNEMTKEVHFGQSILRYFKPKFSPIKEHNGQNSF